MRDENRIIWIKWWAGSNPQAPARLQKAVMSMAVLPKTRGVEEKHEVTQGQLISVLPYSDRGSLDAADASRTSFPDSGYQMAINGILWDLIWGLSNVFKTILTWRKLCRMSKGKIQTGEGDWISQDKVSYATLLLVLLQVTNYCILISMLPEQGGGGEGEWGGKKGGGKQKSSKIKGWGITLRKTAGWSRREKLLHRCKKRKEKKKSLMGIRAGKSSYFDILK